MCVKTKKLNDIELNRMDPKDLLYNQTKNMPAAAQWLHQIKVKYWKLQCTIDVVHKHSHKMLILNIKSILELDNNVKTFLFFAFLFLCCSLNNTYSNIYYVLNCHSLYTSFHLNCVCVLKLTNIIFGDYSRCILFSLYHLLCVCRLTGKYRSPQKRKIEIFDSKNISMW